MAVAVFEIGEEDGIDRDPEGLQVGDDALGRWVEVGGDDRQPGARVALVEGFGAAERFAEEHFERLPTLAQHEGLEVVVVERFDPGAVVEHLGDDVAWGLVAFEFEDVEGGLGVDCE